MSPEGGREEEISERKEKIEKGRGREKVNSKKMMPRNEIGEEKIFEAFHSLSFALFLLFLSLALSWFSFRFLLLCKIIFLSHSFFKKKKPREQKKEIVLLLLSASFMSHLFCEWVTRTIFFIFFSFSFSPSFVLFFSFFFILHQWEGSRERINTCSVVYTLYFSSHIYQKNRENEKEERRENNWVKKREKEQSMSRLWLEVNKGVNKTWEKLERNREEREREKEKEERERESKEKKREERMRKKENSSFQSSYDSVLICHPWKHFCVLKQPFLVDTWVKGREKERERELEKERKKLSSSKWTENEFFMKTGLTSFLPFFFLFSIFPHSFPSFFLSLTFFVFWWWELVERDR